ncbi:excalibur calcium-binding domain-containing protein [Cupriavidus agavae]|uniref:Putative cold-shock DNA-binding protein n=1 Tax=Cupriavidus agavae TaxID=1001822 RepID=A0A4Q7S999_9BURK|nr:excalibur calcium-binding domain-containing protein [Cupriavidus agavae]RZT43056.1 putative cold-shock DNA-binding protein [Cupriavidus agavae]
MAESSKPLNMRIEGRLKSWNGDKGFGFITPMEGGPDVFVHISDFPREGGPPRPGERLNFQIMLNRDGKTRAILVQRPGAAPAAARRGSPQPPVRTGKVTGYRVTAWVVVAMLCAAAFAGYDSLARRSSPPVASITEPVEEPVAVQPVAFRCDGRKHCSEMTSCPEARFFLNNCPGTKMDGDGDGVPCEEHWCRGNFAR